MPELLSGRVAGWAWRGIGAGERGTGTADGASPRFVIPASALEGNRVRNLYCGTFDHNCVIPSRLQHALTATFPLLSGNRFLTPFFPQCESRGASPISETRAGLPTSGGLARLWWECPPLVGMPALLQGPSVILNSFSVAAGGNLPLRGRSWCGGSVSHLSR